MKYELNFTPMMNWSGYSIFSSRFLKLLPWLLLGLTVQTAAQRSPYSSETSYEAILNSSAPAAPNLADSSKAGQHYPDPHNVLYKSLIIPGWGQVVNHQAWKVPIVYALIGGLTGYSIYLTTKYHDYRAAYYNLNDQTPDDRRFGSTPAYLQNANLSFLKSNRDSFHNRRDFIYITVFLAYGLNAVDAYVFANLRTFDVSSDLSVRTSLKPHVGRFASPGLSLSFQLFNKHK